MICITCKIEKEISNFSFRKDTNKYRTECKECVKLRYRKCSSKYKNYVKQWYIKNKKRIQYYHKEYYLKNRNHFIEKSQEWVNNNNEKRKNTRNKYVNKRLKIDINFKLQRYLRSRLKTAIKNNQKSGSAVKNLGCSIQELKIHLEKQFKEGMTWDNWSRTGWHIDHILPLSKFELSNSEELEIACHYTNLQPLWAEENLSKGNSDVVWK